MYSLAAEVAIIKSWRIFETVLQTQQIRASGRETNSTPSWLETLSSAIACFQDWYQEKYFVQHDFCSTSSMRVNKLHLIHFDTSLAVLLLQDTCLDMSCCYSCNPIVQCITPRNPRPQRICARFRNATFLRVPSFDIIN